jgi:chromosome partitioning protein
MKIITIAHQKGGVGKTTLTLNLATCLKKAGKKIAILDTDVQGSLTDTSHTLEGVAFLSPDGLKDINNLPYDYLFIDTPPYLTELLNELFSISDFVLIPTTIGVYDALAIRATLAIIKDVQKSKTGLKYGVVLNRVRSGTSLIIDIVNMLHSYDAVILETRIHERISYAKSAITNGIFGTEDLKAQNEIFNLTTEIITLI